MRFIATVIDGAGLQPTREPNSSLSAERPLAA
jgi:hypothetical protein